MTQVMTKAKWLIPVIVIVAMLATVGLVWGAGGSNDGAGGSYMDFNPSYSSIMVGPPEEEAEDAEPVPLLYTIEIDPPNALIASDSGEILTIVVTNNTPADSTGVDIIGDVVLKATIWFPDQHAPNLPAAASYPILTYGDAFNLVGNAIEVDVITFEDITIHPERSVTFMVPASVIYNPNTLGSLNALANKDLKQGMILLYKAELGAGWACAAPVTDCPAP